MGFAGRGNKKDRQLGMGMGFAVRTEWEWQNTEWGSLPLTVLIGSRDYVRVVLLLEMAMGKNPLGITCPNPYPRRKNMPAKKPIPMTGIKFCPNPYLCGFRVPNGFPIPTNINIKHNSSCK